MKSLNNQLKDLSKEQKRAVIVEWASKELSDRMFELDTINNEIFKIISHTGNEIIFEPITGCHGKRNRLKFKLNELLKSKNELDIKINYLQSILEQFS